MSNSVEIDELITLVSFPYIVGLSRAGRKSAASIIYAIGGAERRRERPRGRPGPSLKGPRTFRRGGIVSFSPLIAFRVRSYPFLNLIFAFLLPTARAVDDFCRGSRERCFDPLTRVISLRIAEGFALHARRENRIRRRIYKIPTEPLVFSEAFRLLRAAIKLRYR